MTYNWREKDSLRFNEYIEKLGNAFDSCEKSTKDKLSDFTKYVPKTSIMQFISRYELYKLIENVPGSIIEIGVCSGSGLFSFVQSVFINEPGYVHRNIIGFDTFEGFPSISDKDGKDQASHLKHEGAFYENSYDELYKLKMIHEEFRFMNNRSQIQLVKGDVSLTVPQFLTNNPGEIVALLYLDADLYEPTMIALKYFWPRIPKGGVVVLDEAIMREWPGEAIALHEYLGIGNCRLQMIRNLKQFFIIKE